jgi:hypothetical protein
MDETSLHASVRVEHAPAHGG